MSAQDPQDPSYGTTTQSMTRQSYGKIVNDLVYVALAKSDVYSTVTDWNSKSPILSKLQRFLPIKKLGNHLTKWDISQYGSGSLWSLDLSKDSMTTNSYYNPKSFSGFDNYNKMKSAIMSNYEDYLSKISSRLTSTPPSRDSDIFAVSYFMLNPLIFYTLTGTYYLLQYISALKSEGHNEKMSIPFRSSVLTKTNISRVSSSNLSNLDTYISSNKELSDPEMNKLLKMMIYYMTIHKYNITT